MNKSDSQMSFEVKIEICRNQMKFLAIMCDDEFIMVSHLAEIDTN